MRKLIMGVLIFLAIGGSIGAYAWWDQLTDDSNSETVTVGVGLIMTVGVDTGSGAFSTKTLIPAGAILKEDDVTSITLEYNVIVNNVSLTDVQLNVTRGTVLNNDATPVDVTDLVNVLIEWSYVVPLVSVPGDWSVLDPLLQPTLVYDNVGTQTARTVYIRVTITLNINELTPQADIDKVYNKNISFTLTFAATEVE